MTFAEGLPTTDIRDQLRRDHQAVLAGLEALRHETDEPRGHALLARFRQSWMIDTLAKESVVYRAIEGIESLSDSTRADQRFVEHELVDGLFDKLARLKAGTLEWRARLNVARELIMRLIETEYEEVFGRLARRYDATGLAQLGASFDRARAKLALLEEAKAA